MNHHAHGGQGWKHRAEKAEEELRVANHANEGLRQRVTEYRAELESMEQRLACALDEVAHLHAEPVIVKCPREPLPDLRSGGTFHPRIGDKQTGLSPHLTVNVYQDEGVTERSQLRIGELWIKLDDKDANELGGGTADAMATMFSIAVQCSVPVCLLAEKLVALRGGPFGPVWKDYGNGLEPDREVDHCMSLLDYIGKWLLVHFCGHEPFVRRVEASGG